MFVVYNQNILTRRKDLLNIAGIDVEANKKSHKGDKCPNCGSKDIIYSQTETMCNNCKLILQSNYYYVAGQKIVLDWGLI